MLRVMLGALLTVAPFVFLFGLPWVQIGIWPDAETVTVALHFVSGLSAAALAAMALLGYRRALAAIRHPITLCFATLAALSALQAAFSPIGDFDATQTLHGLLGRGIGGIWFLDCAVMCAGYLATAQGNWRLVHAVSGGTAAIIAATLGIAAIQPSDWLGPVALLASVPLFATGRRPLFMAGAAIFAFTAGSASTWLAAIVAAFAVGILGRGRFALPARRFRTAVLVSALAFTAGIPALLSMMPEPLEFIATSKVNAITMNIDGIPSNDRRDHVSIDAEPYGGLWASARSAKAITDNLLAHPQYLAVGRGWGSFPDIVTEQMRSIPGRSFAVASETSSRTSWKAAITDNLYARNLALEALASLGLIGAAAIALLLVSPLLWARDRDVLAAAFLVLGTAIAVSSSTLRSAVGPFLALAFASVGRIDRAPLRKKKAISDLALATVAAIAGPLLIYFAAILFGVANLEYVTRKALPHQLLRLEACRPFAGYLSPAYQINEALFRRFVDQGEADSAPFAWFTRRIVGTMNYSCTMRDLAEHGAGAAFLASSLELRDRLLRSSGNFPPLVAALDTEVKHWGEDIARLLSIAPGRTDVIIPYVSWTVARGDKEASLAAISAMAKLTSAPDPVAAWLKARRAELAGDEAEYRTQMTLALRTGIANLLPMRRSETDAFIQRGIAGR